MIRLLRSDDDGWSISAFVPEHNHELTKTCGQKQEWFSHGNIDQSAKDMIQYLRENKVSLTKVHCIMGSMLGAIDNNPFGKKSIKKFVHKLQKTKWMKMCRRHL